MVVFLLCPRVRCPFVGECGEVRGLRIPLSFHVRGNNTDWASIFRWDSERLLPAELFRSHPTRNRRKCNRKRRAAEGFHEVWMRRIVHADFLHHPRIVLLRLRGQLIYLLGCDLCGLRRRDLGRCGIALAEHLGERTAPQARKGAGRHGREQVFQHAGPLLGTG